MKTFVILLLLANLAWFSWNQGWIGELSVAVATVLGKPGLEAGKAPDLSPVMNPGVPPFEQAASSLTLLSELTDIPVQSGDDVDDGTDIDITGEAAGFAPPDQEINEQLAEGNPNPSVDQNPQAELVVTPSPAPWCGILGYFAEESATAALIPELVNMGFSTELRTGPVPVSSTYWVYMPAFASEAEAFSELEELQDQGIDSYYMRTGAWAGGISLGVFSRESSAQVVQESLAMRGYQTQIGEVFREEPRFWLALTTEFSAILESRNWLDFRANHSTLQLTENVCEAVASTPQLP